MHFPADCLLRNEKYLVDLCAPKDERIWLQSSSSRPSHQCMSRCLPCQVQVSHPSDPFRQHQSTDACPILKRASRNNVQFHGIRPPMHPVFVIHPFRFQVPASFHFVVFRCIQESQTYAWLRTSFQGRSPLVPRSRNQLAHVCELRMAWSGAARESTTLAACSMGFRHPRHLPQVLFLLWLVIH